MFKITKISPQKRKGRDSVFLVGKLKDAALRFLAVRPRSEFEVRGYLKRKIWQNKAFEHLGNSAEGRNILESIVEKLKSLNYLNDVEFTRWWIEQRRTTRHPKGTRLIKAELLKKGIPPATFTDILLTTAEKKFPSQGPSEEELAYQVAQKKLKSYQSLPRWELRRKLGNYLTRRGFDGEVVQRVIFKLVDKRE